MAIRQLLVQITHEPIMVLVMEGGTHELSIEAMYILYTSHNADVITSDVPVNLCIAVDTTYILKAIYVKEKPIKKWATVPFPQDFSLFYLSCDFPTRMLEYAAHILHSPVLSLR